ncbi:MAG TPA: sn-glycerol-3-phosphate ABC transporter substrate-binding protein UgpB, partial [Burkholderiaceae bacterium]|nr:sn-glycerol-3-phosphate ABC transporter substrate-binding protein UgpB [Burkholderiaceae bacterium]
MKIQSLALAAGALALGLSGPAQAQVEVQWWHSMTGGLNDWVNDLAKDFNASQKDYKVVPSYKGTYAESMTATMAAFRAGNAPHIVQVFEVGTATMMNAKGAVKPVGEVMTQSGVAFDPKGYVPAVSAYYTAPNGQMMSFPFNSSTTIFYYNKDAFKAAGLDPNKAPGTWPEVVAAAAKLKANGSKCPYTTSWMSWVHLESFSLWHNTLFATQNNGFGGPGARLAFNSPLHLRHFENLSNMAKQGLFVYKGRDSVAVQSFVAGDCAMLTGSSGSYADVAKSGKFAYGLAPLPYYPDVAGAPQNTAIGGASLWVMAGKKPAEYKGVAEFFKYLSSPEVQSASHKRTGYLPITMAAFQLTEKSGFYKDRPGTDVAVTQM